VAAAAARRPGLDDVQLAGVLDPCGSVGPSGAVAPEHPEVDLARAEATQVLAHEVLDRRVGVIAGGIAARVRARDRWHPDPGEALAAVGTAADRAVCEVPLLTPLARVQIHAAQRRLSSCGSPERRLGRVPANPPSPAARPHRSERGRRRRERGWTVPARARGCGRGECRHPSCTLTPAQEEGPYYLDLDRIRKDITEGKAGLRLDLSSALLRPR